MRTVQQQSGMRDIYDRLRPLGFNPRFLKTCILPDWWDDGLANVPANRAYAEGVIAKQLGMDLAALRNPSYRLEIMPHVSARFKCRQGTKDNQLRPVETLGWRMAVIAGRCITTPLHTGKLSASDIRSSILHAGAPWVGLPELVNYCWEAGIPVVNLRQVPTGCKKPDGMALWPEERPTVIVASGRRQPAWHLFIVAHELGHIACGHVKQGEAATDCRIELGATDEDEHQANRFAVELLTGDPETEFTGASPWMTAEQLADAARRTGARVKVDPGFVALNYARNKGFYAVGAAALNCLTPDGNASLFYESALQRLDLSQVTEDNRRVLECLTEVA